MRLVTFTREKTEKARSRPRVGALSRDGAHILDFARVCRQEQNLPLNPLDWFDLDGVWFGQARRRYEEITTTAKDLDLTDEEVLVKRSAARLLAPVPRPGKLICIGLNYRDHAAESKMAIPEKPVIFSKFTTSIVGPEEPVVLPATSDQVDYEAELAVVIGRRAKRVSVERALNYVLGYTMVNDVSARDFQFGDGQWQRGKSCDTFAPMGPFILTADEVSDPHRLSIKLRLNGNTMQDSNTDQLIFGVPELVAFLSETITLEPGDVIATGTPPGVGFARKPPVFIKSGDVMEVEVESLGILRNPVVAAAESISAGKFAYSKVQGRNTCEE
jgi:2-keto-4-pentenoate hydratase/2-oxohepta-3-ene-1,7-dioic acid hydratase in catechol pathway